MILSHLHDVLFLPFEIAADYILPLSAFFLLVFFFSPRIYSLCSFQGSLVGSSGLEPPTSRLSGVRSNHLSYEPMSFLQRGSLSPLVEMNGIEPMTPCLQSRCSPS